MALDACVKQIICSLSAGVLGALDDAIDVQLAQLQGAVVAAQAQILKYDVLALPVQAANTAAQAALAQLKAFAGLVPSNLITGCTDMGNITIEMQRAIDGVAGPLNDYTQDLARLLSIREELNALVEEYNQIIDTLNQLKAVIAECALQAVA